MTRLFGDVVLVHAENRTLTLCTEIPLWRGLTASTIGETR